MPVEREEEFSVSVFLMEAWDAIAELEAGLSARTFLLQALVSAWQYLHATASQHSFPAIADLADFVYAGLSRLTDEASPDDVIAADLARAADVFKPLLDGLALDDDERAATEPPLVAAPEPTLT